MRKYFLTVLLIILSQSCTSKVENTVYNVYDFGAKGDGVTNDQKAIQKAIDACENAVGTVLLKEGIFLTGQLLLVNNLTINIDSTATILGIKSDAEIDYPHHLIETKFPNRILEDCQRRLIYGNKVNNVTITGGGTINGQGDYEPWMHVKELGTEKDRPSILAFVGSKNITGTNFTQQYPSIITGIEVHHIQNITFENLDFELKGGVNTTSQTVMEYDGKYPEGSKFGNTNA